MYIYIYIYIYNSPPQLRKDQHNRRVHPGLKNEQQSRKRCGGGRGSARTPTPFTITTLCVP